MVSQSLLHNKPFEGDSKLLVHRFMVCFTKTRARISGQMKKMNLKWRLNAYFYPINMHSFFVILPFPYFP